MSADRFEEVKHNFENGYPNAGRRLTDIAWLVAEVERLRNERAQFVADAATAVAEMRAAVVETPTGEEPK